MRNRKSLSLKLAGDSYTLSSIDSSGYSGDSIDEWPSKGLQRQRE
jgi:hypothetical protein